MRTRGILLFAISSLTACSADSATQPAPGLDMAIAISVPDLAESSSDLGSPPGDLATRIVTQCGNIPVLGRLDKNPSAACLGCIALSCCSEGVNCGSDLFCVAQRNCDSDCSTIACLNNCAATFSNPVAKGRSDAFDKCRTSKCNPACNQLSCIGSVVWPRPAQASYTMKIFSLDFSTGAYIPHVLVKVCPPGDAACTNPTATGTTDMSGFVTLNVPVTDSGQDGFLELTWHGAE